MSVPNVMMLWPSMNVRRRYKTSQHQFSQSFCLRRIEDI